MNLLGIREMEKSDILQLISLSQQLKRDTLSNKPIKEFSGKSVGMLFLEDSTRTRVSFEQAARRLKIHTTSFGMQGSSMAKGESLKDTVLTLRHEGIDGLVMRHRSSGAATLAASLFDGPVINAGDGMHEHPTQALADVLTVLEHREKIEGLKIAIVGDVLHSRVARSNIWMFSKLGAEVRIIGPKTLMPRFCGNLPAHLSYDLSAGLQGVDVVMALRLQKERMSAGLISSTGEYASLYQINSRSLRAALPDCLVMHPGPINRGVELDDQTADSKQSVITEQVENSVYARMASFTYVFSSS